jgi:hypothetical protein
LNFYFKIVKKIELVNNYMPIDMRGDCSGVERIIRVEIVLDGVTDPDERFFIKDPGIEAKNKTAIKHEFRYYFVPLEEKIRELAVPIFIITQETSQLTFALCNEKGNAHTANPNHCGNFFFFFICFS